jgi:prevent-host-death family protein
MKCASEHHQPIIITQKGSPSGVLLDIGTYEALRGLAERHRRGKG